MVIFFEMLKFTIHISIDVSGQKWLNERWCFIFNYCNNTEDVFKGSVFFTYEWKISENYTQLPLYARVLHLFIAVNCIKC